MRSSKCITSRSAFTRSHDASIHHPQVWICHLRSSDPRSTGLDLQITGCEHSTHRMCRWSTHTYMHSYVRLHTHTCTATVSGAARAATRYSDAVHSTPDPVVLPEMMMWMVYVDIYVFCSVHWHHLLLRWILHHHSNCATYVHSPLLTAIRGASSSSGTSVLPALHGQC